MTVRYDASSGPSGGPTRGAIALRDHWREVTDLGDLGIYNPRRIRGSTAWSIHASGRAVDFACNAHDPAQKAKADTYVEFLIRHSEAFQIQYLIWNRRSWKSGRGWRNYSGVSPHTDHIHVELNTDGGERLSLSKLRTQWDRDHATPEQEDEMRFTVAEAAEYVKDGYRHIAKREATDVEVYLWAHAIADDAREMWKMQQRLVGEAIQARS